MRWTVQISETCDMFAKVGTSESCQLGKAGKLSLSSSGKQKLNICTKDSKPHGIGMTARQALSAEL